MNYYFIETPVKVYCLDVSPFPTAIKPAYDLLHQLYPPGNGRTYFGISYPDRNGGIMYKAATSLAPTDEPPTDVRFSVFTIRAGKYASAIIRDFMKDPTAIRQCFAEMIELPEVARDGYCLEMYLNPNDVQCMVLLQ